MIHTEKSPIVPTERAKKLARIAKNLAPLVALSAVAGGVAYEAHHANVEQLHKQRVEALSNTNPLNEVIVLKGGASYRSTPETINGQDPSDTNKLGTIPKGKTWIVRQPRANETEHPGWVAFRKPDVKPTDIRTNDELVDATVWVNADALADQGYVTETPFIPVPEGGQLADTNDVYIGSEGASAVASSLEVDDSVAKVLKLVEPS